MNISFEALLFALKINMKSVPKAHQHGIYSNTQFSMVSYLHIILTYIIITEIFNRHKFS